ncbi:uncharacterized protein LOC116927497 [Daphnia magna]|uniref:Uncharacterized protein n=1 Tax=Daphnia magna TaxID=35525 RepID=A0A164M2F8_9CRUS|nr:uncharacterized protein LOC116927497 [Daphnia magna]KZS04662.1 Uncharacterized protein APZ42_032346 [Daphnia magna]
MPRSTSASDTVSDSNSDSEESIDKSSRKREKFSRKRAMEDQEEGELHLPADPQHEVEDVPDNDGQDEIPGEPKEPKRPKLDLDVTEFRVSSTSSKKIRKWISKSFAKSKAKKLRERFQPKFSSSFELLNPEMDDSVYRRLKELKNLVATKEKIDNKESEMRAMQFKILDIVRPMLFIWETAQEETARDAAKVAIKQWAHAFFACTDFRRNNLLKQTNPSFVVMLKREKNFDEKEFEMLFGDLI